jgi:polysaccharide deacetylase family protein (PEP-CTERM system associated)
MVNVLSVDVEEYFHPTEVQKNVSEWDRLPSRVEDQTRRILELFACHDVRATFFIVGWLADRHPRLVREIAAAGHEIGCHSYEHRLVYDLTPDAFQRDTERAVSALSNACGSAIRSYRAPSYSITQKSIWALDVLASLGFTHDSSIYPIAHDRYGIPGFARHAETIQTASGPICEVPIATVEVFNGHTAPVGGGAYLRILPYRYTAAGLRRINNDERQPACIYFHPWEIDEHQPRLATGRIARVRTYSGLRSMMHKVKHLLTDFHFSTMADVYPMELAGTRRLTATATR